MAKRLEVEIPEKLWFLFEPHRYRVARGGRGSDKSWIFASALLVLPKDNDGKRLLEDALRFGAQQRNMTKIEE